MVIDCDAQRNVAIAFDVNGRRTLCDLLQYGEVDVIEARKNLYIIDSGGRELAETVRPTYADPLELKEPIRAVHAPLRDNDGSPVVGRLEDIDGQFIIVARRIAEKANRLAGALLNGLL